MRRLFAMSAITVLFVATTSLSYAGTTVKGSKSNSDNRIEAPAAPAGAVPGKDPCGDHKKDTNKFAACQKAAKLGRATLSGGGSEARVTVCSGGYWWTIESLGGPITQGGSCSPEGAIK